MRNHGTEKNRATNKARKTKAKSQKNKEATRLARIRAEYNRMTREMAKRPQYKGNVDNLDYVREPWDPQTDYDDREFYLDPKTGKYYDVINMRLAGYTKPNGKIVPLKPIR